MTNAYTERTTRADAIHLVIVSSYLPPRRTLFGGNQDGRREFKLGDVVSLRSGGPRMTIATGDGQSSFLRMVYRRPTTAKQIFLPHQFEARRSAMNEWV
ncbi:MAG: DUF2158 domain-containing protein [Gemmatimonas sp.]